MGKRSMALLWLVARTIARQAHSLACPEPLARRGILSEPGI